MAKAKKPFTSYVHATYHDGIRGYFSEPVHEFFEQVLDIGDAFSLCLRQFPKKTNGDYTKAAMDSQLQLSAACLVTIMGHFELYQRFTFAGLIEHSVHLNGFDLPETMKRLRKDLEVQIDPAHLLAYRSETAAAGQMFVDNLPGWHDPRRVNTYFRAMRPTLTFYSNDQVDDLQVLWQLRHTVAHTGGWLSLPDAQKVPALKSFKNRALYFAPQFIEVLLRRLHKIVPDCAARLKGAFDKDVDPAFTKTAAYRKFFRISSPRNSWV